MKRRDPFQCPQCGSTAFELARQITVWQTVLVNAVCPQGHYGVQYDELGETVQEHAIQRATCVHCRTDLSVSTLLPWTVPPAEGAEATGPDAEQEGDDPGTDFCGGLGNHGP